MKRLLAAGITAGLLLGLLSIAQPVADAATPRVDTFTDVGPAHPFVAEIGWLATEGIATGFDDGTFRPGAAITRQALAGFLYRYDGGATDPDDCPVAPFPDVPVDHPFCAEIDWLAQQDIADGFDDGTFRPAATITRQALAAMLYRLGGSPDGLDPACTEPPFTDVAVDHPFCAEIDWLAREDIAEGYADGSFGPERTVTRQAFAAFLFRYDGWAPLPSPGCGTSTTGALVEVERPITVDEVERRYLLTTPTAHDGHTPVPLVLDFHGFAEGATIHTMMSKISPIAEREGFAVAFPHGTGDPVRWNIALDPATNPDLIYVDAVLDELGDDLCVDLRRVYAMGLSMGAMMSSNLACTMSTRFAAVAPVAGVQDRTPCAAGRGVPMLSFHGTADTILPFNTGGGPVDLDGTGYPAAVAGWAARNGCDPVATDTDVTDEVIKRVYDCPDNADVEFFIILGGGHTWPGSVFSQSIEAVVGYTTFDIDATEEAWAFFERFHLQ